MKTTFKLIVLFILLIVVQSSFSQTYQGPAQGSVASGVTVTTNSFLRTDYILDPKPKAVRNKIPYTQEPQNYDFGTTNPPVELKYFEDSNTKSSSNPNPSIESPILLKSFQGIPQQSGIPPDPHIAVGPTHVVGIVNSRFTIWDKEGNIIKSIDAEAWFNTALSNNDCFDPKVLYDHFEKRWIMVWLQQNDANTTSNYLLSVSDDSIPTGTWYNWALPSNKNGNTTVNNWGDYQGVGFDKDAIYISSNQFTFATQPSFQYVKIRIIPKTQLYNNTASAVNWFDIWDITYVSNGQRVFNIRPSISYESESSFNLLHIPSGGGNFMVLYKIQNSISNPSLSGNNVFVTFTNNAPNANQLGGSTILLEGGGSACRNEPTYRNGFLYAVHSIANPSSFQNSSLRYVKINVSSNSAVEDFALGAPGYWYFYNALAVDKDENVALAYSRSGNTEYAGAFYTTRLKGDPPGFILGSMPLQTGKGNYVKDFGQGRNRWGDYNGIWLDPADQNNFWMMMEYAAATNTWGTWVGKIRLVPFAGVVLYTATPTIDFGNIEVNYSSDTVTAVIRNYGSQNLVISNITNSIGPFRMISNFSYPLTLSSFDSILVRMLFSPLDTGNYLTSLTVSSNDPVFTGFEVKGRGYVIKPATQNVLYSSSGTNNGSNFSTINTASGSGTNIGPLRNSDVKSISVNPINKIVYGLGTSVSSSRLLRVNAEKGDAYTLYEYSVGDLAAIAFDTLGILYVAAKNGNLYTLDLIRGELDSFARAPIQITSIAINPTDNQLWASILVPLGAGKDRLYKLNKTNGDTTRVGQTGFAIATNGLAFDFNGNLYGITGTPSLANNLISINTTTGVGTLIGATGLKHLTGLAYLAVKPTSVESMQFSVPSEFSLLQNYPNPFNPATTIEFALPVTAQIKVKVYDILGRVIKVIYDGMKNAGFHQMNWNSDDVSGGSVSSGVYFYELNAVGVDGREFNQMKKMIFMK